MASSLHRGNITQSGRARGGKSVAKPRVMARSPHRIRKFRLASAGCTVHPQKHVGNATPRGLLHHGVSVSWGSLLVTPRGKSVDIVKPRWRFVHIVQPRCKSVHIVKPRCKYLHIVKPRCVCDAPQHRPTRSPHNIAPQHRTPTPPPLARCMMAPSFLLQHS